MILKDNALEGSRARLRRADAARTIREADRAAYRSLNALLSRTINEADRAGSCPALSATVSNEPV